MNLDMEEVERIKGKFFFPGFYVATGRLEERGGVDRLGRSEGELTDWEGAKGG